MNAPKTDIPSKFIPTKANAALQAQENSQFKFKKKSDIELTRNITKFSNMLGVP